MMTREEFKRKINTLSCWLSYPTLDALHEIDDHDADQRVEIERLEEWKRIVLGTGTDQEAVIRMAAAEYTQAAIRCWKDKCEHQAQEIARLREALERIVESEGLWTKNDMAYEAQQALRESTK